MSEFKTMKLTENQKNELDDLNRWFHGELAKLRKKQLDILHRYDEKVTNWKQMKLKKKLKDL